MAPLQQALAVTHDDTTSFLCGQSNPLKLYQHHFFFLMDKMKKMGYVILQVFSVLTFYDHFSLIKQL